MTVMCIKLVTGEELIGEVISKPSDYNITIKAAAAIHMVPSPDGQQMGMGLIPWLPYANEDSFTIAKENLIVQPFEPVTEFLNKYNRLFGSGIQIATSLNSVK